MALLDVLQERTQRRCRTAQVLCGELGLLTVEALPPAELERLQTDRAVLYAACRELQRAGETLRQAGRLFAPDEITAYLSDDEAEAGARTVRDISGMTASRRDAQIPADTASGEDNGAEADTGAGTDAAPEPVSRTNSPASPADMASGRTENGEIRLDAVQAEPAEVSPDSGHGEKNPDASGAPLSDEPPIRTENREIRLDAVQASGSETTKVRHDPVQTAAPADRKDPASLPRNRSGQDSREFFPAAFRQEKTDKQSQGIVDLPDRDTRNLGEMGSVPSGEKPEDGTAKEALLPHETESEIPERLHETTSEINGTRTEALHETESEVPEAVHEITSETGETAPGTVHEIKSEVRKAVHEMESELTDRVARSILEGLRRAALVR